MPLPVSMDATWLDGSVQFNGQELRRADGALYTGDGNSPFGVQGGIVRHNDSSLAVTVNASDVVTIQPGAAVIPGNAGVGNGVYRSALAAAETGSLVARNATNPRIDLVIFRVLDTSVVGTHGAYTGRIEVLAGTPAASPVVPTLPTLAIELARITVPASGGAAASVDSTWRTFAAAIGGILPVTTFARLPTAPNAKWLEAVTIDTGQEYRWNGTAWVAIDALVLIDLTTTPALVLGADMANTGDGTRAWKRNNVVTVEIYLSANVATSSFVLNMPSGWRPPAGIRFSLNLSSSTTERAALMNNAGDITIEGGLTATQSIFGHLTYVV